jgi:hypothetical protein
MKFAFDTRIIESVFKVFVHSGKYAIDDYG